MKTQKCISDADIGCLLEGDLSEQQRKTLQQHIDICPDCRAHWQQASAGSKYIKDMFSAAWQSQCLSEDLISGFVNGILNLEKKKIVQDHIAQCPRCEDVLAEMFADAYSEHGDVWWSEYVGCQMLTLFAQLSEEEINGILKSLIIVSPLSASSATIIKLPVVEPTESRLRDLAAATGEGFHQQNLHQDKPAFEFQLVQFGEQVRIIARSEDENSPYKDCLAKLELYEGQSCLRSRIVLVEKGEAQCIFEPEEVRRLKPKQSRLALKLVPIVTLDKLASIGSEAYMPILAKLLEHKEAKIRRSTIEVAARIFGPQAHSLIKSLLEDKDGKVRTAAKKALDRFPKQQDMDDPTV